MRVPRARALVYAIIALIMGAAAWALGVANVLGQRAEALVLEAALLNYEPPAPLGLVSTPAAVGALAVIAAIAWWVHGFPRAVSAICTTGVAVVASQLLKQDVLVRPELFGYEAANTFPSGHMTLFVSLTGALIWAVPRQLQTLTVILGSALCATVAWQLLEHSWHRPSDILGALALSLCACALWAAVFPLTSKKRLSPARRTVTIVNRMLSFALLAVSVLMLVGGAALTLGAVWSGSAQLMLHGAQFALMGITALTIRALQTLVP